jgi:hypothetical protein
MVPVLGPVQENDVADKSQQGEWPLTVKTTFRALHAHEHSALALRHNSHKNNLIPNFFYIGPGIAQSVWWLDWGLDHWVVVDKRSFLSLKCPNWLCSPDSYPVISGALSLSVCWPRHEADYSHPSNAELKGTQDPTSIPPPISSIHLHALNWSQEQFHPFWTCLKYFSHYVDQ